MGGLIDREGWFFQTKYTENASQDPVNYAAHQLVNESSKKELDFLMPIVSKILDTLRSDQFKEITEDTSLY